MKLRQLTESLEKKYKLNENEGMYTGGNRASVLAKTMPNRDFTVNGKVIKGKDLLDYFEPNDFIKYFSSDRVHWKAIKSKLDEALNNYKYEAEVKDKSGKGIAVVKGKIKAKTEIDAENKIHDILTIDKGYESSDIKEISVKFNENVDFINEKINPNFNYNEFLKLDEFLKMKTSVKALITVLYPDDDLCQEIDDNITFGDVKEALDKGIDIYNVIGVDDSVIREYVFKTLADILNVSYDDIYALWMKNN